MWLNLKSFMALGVSASYGYPLTAPLASTKLVVAVSATKLPIELLTLAQFSCAATQATPLLSTQNHLLLWRGLGENRRENAQSPPKPGAIPIAPDPATRT